MTDPASLQERLVEALTADPFRDQFVFAAGVVTRLVEDGAGLPTWRTKVSAHLAGRPFGGVQLDVSPRAHELDQTEMVSLPNSLSFAGIDAPRIEIIDIHRHAAEKLHGMTRSFGERENSRVRDLADLVILREHGLLEPVSLAAMVRRVWSERDGGPPPLALPALPAGWLDRYAQIALAHDLATPSLAGAIALVTTLWTDMFPAREV